MEHKSMVSDSNNTSTSSVGLDRSFYSIDSDMESYYQNQNEILEIELRTSNALYEKSSQNNKILLGIIKELTSKLNQIFLKNEEEEGQEEEGDSTDQNRKDIEEIEKKDYCSVLISINQYLVNQNQALLDRFESVNREMENLVEENKRLNHKAQDDLEQQIHLFKENTRLSTRYNALNSRFNALEIQLSSLLNLNDNDDNEDEDEEKEEGDYNKKYYYTDNYDQDHEDHFKISNHREAYHKERSISPVPSTPPHYHQSPRRISNTERKSTPIKYPHQNHSQLKSPKIMN